MRNGIAVNHVGGALKKPLTRALRADTNTVTAYMKGEETPYHATVPASDHRRRDDRGRRGGRYPRRRSNRGGLAHQRGVGAPYNRPSLSKALWKDTALDSIWGKTKDKRFTLHSGRVIKEILPRQQRVLDDKGQRFTYHTLLSATLTETGQRFGVIGGGLMNRRSRRRWLG